MANRGYDVVVDVDAEGDLGHTDLQEDDLEFHSSNFDDPPSRNKPSAGLPFHNNSNGGSGSGSGGSGSGTLSSKRYLWSLAFYAQFFDVDTSTVLYRSRIALFPTTNFLDALDGNPDLYGPFWIATTVIFILFLTGTISQYLDAQDKSHFAYDFELLSGATGLVYGYTFGIPVGLWAVLRWFGSEGANLMECVSLYGYANLIWIAVALISWSPKDILNWIFVAAGFAASSFFLIRNLWPIVSAADQKVSRVLPIIVVVLHAGFAVTVKFLFFAHSSPIKKSTDGDNTIESMMRF